ncbi:MAG: cytochrome c3 family protein [Candidatus Binatia bacterium]
MKRAQILVFWLSLAMGCFATGAARALDPPHDASRSIDCTNCHITHHAAGGAITTVAGNPNLCISCHTAGGVASTTPFANADEAIPGTGGTSHRWDSGSAGWVKTSLTNTSPGTVQSGGSFTGRYRKTCTITVTTAGDMGTALFNWSTSNLVSQTYLDSFTAIAYNGTNGTQNWSASPWQEIVEADGPGAGFIQVAANAACTSGNCLRIGGGAISTRGVQRSANVSQGTSATLSFSYQRQLATCPNTSTANVGLQVSSNGTTWATLATYSLNACDTTQVAQVFDLTPYIAATTQIRFLGVGTAGATDFIYIDNVQIQYLVSGNGATNVTTGTNVALDEGITVTFANGTPSPSFKLNDQWTVFVNPDINQPTTPALALSLASGMITCSTCHNEHSQIAEPFDRAAPAYPAPGPGGAGRHYQRNGDDINQMCVDCHSARNVTASSQGSHPVGVLIPTTGLYKNP